MALPLSARAAPDLQYAEFRVEVDLIGGVVQRWTFEASFQAADTTAMELTPPGGVALALVPDRDVPDEFGANFEVVEDFDSRDELLAAFPSGTYEVRVVDNGARMAFPVPTTTLDGVVVITHPQDGDTAVESEPIITRTRTCSSCDEEIVYLFGVDGENYDVFGQLFREEGLPAQYTLADFDWGPTPVTSLPDGAYELHLTALAEAWEDGRLDNGDRFDLYARAEAADVCRFTVPAPTPALQALSAVSTLVALRRRSSRARG